MRPVRLENLYFVSFSRHTPDVLDDQKGVLMSQSSTRLEIRLKEREDEYTSYKQFHVFVGTFNVNNRQAPHERSLDEWFRQATSNGDEKQTVTVPDILAVGFQEIDTSGGAYLYDDKKKEDEWEQLVHKTIHSAFESSSEKDVTFELLNRVRLIGEHCLSNDSRRHAALLLLSGILLFVYVRTIHLPKCTFKSRSSVPTGFMGIAGNKGGVGIRFRFYETDLCFVNAHFASGDGQTKRRNEDYQAIEARMGFTDGPVYSLKDYIWYTPTSASSTDTPGAAQW